MIITDYSIITEAFITERFFLGRMDSSGSESLSPCDFFSFSDLRREIRFFWG